MALEGNYATADMEMDVVSVGQGGRLCLGRRTGSLLSRPEFSSYRVGIDNLGPTPGYLKMVFLFFWLGPFFRGVPLEVKGPGGAGRELRQGRVLWLV